MRRLSLALLFVAACGPKYRHETIGTAHAGEVIVLGAAGQHRIDWRVQTPRALRMSWTLACGGAEASGVAGESFEEYRARRIAEIRAQREQEKKAVAAVTGAVLGDATATAHADTPDGHADAQVHVDGDAVGAAVAEEVVSDDIQLPPGDLGPGYYGGTITVAAVSPGACTMQFTPEGEEVAGVSAQFQVTRVVDIKEEQRAHAAVRREHAIEVRGTVGAQLVAFGADPELQARLEAEALARREAELRVRFEVEQAARAEQAAIEAAEQAEAAARAEAELAVRLETETRAQAELDAQLRIEADARARLVIGVASTRQSYLAYLVGVCGADPEHRQRQLEAELAARAEAERAARLEAEARAQAQADLRFQAELRARAEADARAQAEMEARLEAEARGRAALEIRARLAGMLVGWGADPYWRQRQAEEEIAARARADAELIARTEAEARVHAERVAELDRRDRMALGVRAEIVAHLQMLGAIEKPPMPDAPYEDPGQPPMDGAVWVAGEWLWQDAQWVWISGGWSFPDDGFSTSVSVGNDVSVGTVIDTAVEITTDRPKVEDHRDDPPPPPPKTEERPKTRDHRDDEPKKERPKTRDHRE